MSRDKHLVRWFGIAGGQRITRTASMMDKDWGWDADCICGWESRTGGAIAARVREAVSRHRLETRS